MIRTDAGCRVSRFAELAGVRWRTYHARLARHRAGDVTKGPWPAPQVDRIESAVEILAADWPAWGHRKIWAMGRYDGWDLGSPSSVHRAMARRPPATRALAGRTPPTRRRPPGSLPGAAGAPQPGPASGLLTVRDHNRGHLATRRCCRLRRQTGSGVPRHSDPDRRRPDLRLENAVEVAEALLGRPLVEDCTDPATGARSSPS